ncbi:MAG TPA: DUF87 domain-containing protein [Acidimicrobiia bacterium]
METKPGQLYLGSFLDEQGERAEDLIYDSADLTTHGVIVGMTGSGKTGLAIDLLEEALLSGIPALIIDPKGDMTNLLLNFPELRPVDFRPWIDESIARREGITPEALAEQTAAGWKEGLASWQIEPERMARLKAAAKFTIYTPGSTAGVPVNVLGSMAAPDTADTEATRDEIEGLVTSLLVLAGVKSDPISGPEHILLATLIEQAWQNKRDLDLATLIQEVVTPPFRKLGVFEVDDFIPSRDRNALAMRLNGLMASPSFAAWRTGEFLDFHSVLLSDAGGPAKAAIFYLAHLSEVERQFFVTLLLAKLWTFIRGWYGSSDLRALIYMDEIAGFCPPTAEPPAKKPIMTIAKQARAFGYGMVLTTQNPMDFDYKVMSNAGTWVIGRLQTERDKARILEALASAAGGVDLDTLDRQISGLGKRQFVLHSTRQAPRVFTSRWAMSYLAGPLSKAQVGELTPDQAGGVIPGVEEPVEPVTTPTPPALEGVSGQPSVATGTPVAFLDGAAGWASTVGASGHPTAWKPMVAATVNLLYDEAPAGIEHREVYEAVLSDLEAPAGEAWLVVDHDPRDFLTTAPAGAVFAPTNAPFSKASYWQGLSSGLRDYLLATRSIRVLKAPGLKLYSRVGEQESDFRARCIAAAEAEADRAIARLRDKYRLRLERVRDQVEAASRRVSDLTEEVAARQQGEVLGGVGDVIGVVFGGRSRRTVSRAASRRSETRRVEARRDTAAGSLTDKQQDLLDLEADLAAEVEAIEAEWDQKAALIEEVHIPLEKTDVKVAELKLVWVPVDDPAT